MDQKKTKAINSAIMRTTIVGNIIHSYNKAHHLNKWDLLHGWQVKFSNDFFLGITEGALSIKTFFQTMLYELSK